MISCLPKAVDRLSEPCLLFLPSLCSIDEQGWLFVSPPAIASDAFTFCAETVPLVTFEKDGRVVKRNRFSSHDISTCRCFEYFKTMEVIPNL